MDKTAAKASSTIGFLRRNLINCTMEVKDTLVLPTFEYAASVWDPYLNTDINKLEQVKRRGTHYVQNNRTTTGTEYQAMSLDSQGTWMSDTWKEKEQHSTSVALQDPAWACRHGARKYSKTQQSQNRRRLSSVPTNSHSECVHVLLLPSHHQRVECTANQGQRCRKPRNIRPLCTTAALPLPTSFLTVIRQYT